MKGSSFYFWSDSSLCEPFTALTLSRSWSAIFCSAAGSKMTFHRLITVPQYWQLFLHIQSHSPLKRREITDFAFGTTLQAQLRKMHAQHMEFKVVLQNSRQRESFYLFTWKIHGQFLYFQVIVMAENTNQLLAGSVREIQSLFILLLNTSQCPKFQRLQDLHFWPHNT